MMNWRPPETEDAWLECLSAYMDGELPPEEHQAVEEYLQKDAVRRKQLRMLAATSDLLREWDVPASEPTPAFIGKFVQNLEESNQSILERFTQKLFRFPSFGRWLQPVAFLFVGILLGGLGMNLYLLPSAEREARQDSPHPTTVNIMVSPSQAENLLKEVAASRMADELMDDLKDGNWKDARMMYENLTEQYPDTLAVQQLEKKQSVRAFKDKQPLAGRI